MSYFPLHVHSHDSILDGLSKPSDIVNRCEEIGVAGSGLTDHGSISGHIKFLQQMKKADKKPLLGCELYVSKEDATIKNERNRKLAHLCVHAKNTAGWRNLVSLISASNDPEYFYHKPRLDMQRLETFAQHKNLMAFSGHIGSHMSNILFDDDGNIKSSWRTEGARLAESLRDMFGKDNFFLEVQLMDSVAFPKQIIIADCIRAISIDTGIPCVATQDAHYARKEDAEDQRVLLCANMRTTIKEASKPEFGMSGFFRSRQYHIPSYEEMQQWHTEEELDNTLLFASRIEDYQGILRSPMLPTFTCPGGIAPNLYLRALCKEGQIQRTRDNAQNPVYLDRLDMELKVLEKAELSSYFLIVSDIMNYVRSNNWLPGPGRGSAAGSLVSYLIGITDIDPMPHGLMFERFYNPGRNTPGHISMPDIDMDVPKYARERVINHIRDKYGADKVGQMVTFQTRKGKGSLKDVMRAYGGISFDEMNEITKNLIEEHRISDELQRMKEDTGESSIIQWCLENWGEKLKKWCYLDEAGVLCGPLAARFAQAIRLEGTKSNVSKHPAGVVICPEPLADICPMLYDKETGLRIAAFEMSDLEAIGGIKFDVLGITSLDKAMGMQQDLATGEIYEIR